MQTTPQTGFPALEAAAPCEPRRRDERTYQWMTVAAILAVLATVWVF